MKSLICPCCSEGCWVYLDEKGEICGNGCLNGAIFAMKKFELVKEAPTVGVDTAAADGDK